MSLKSLLMLHCSIEGILTDEHKEWIAAWLFDEDDSESTGIITFANSDFLNTFICFTLDVSGWLCFEFALKEPWLLLLLKFIFYEYVGGRPTDECWRIFAIQIQFLNFFNWWVLVVFDIFQLPLTFCILKNCHVHIW